MADDQCLQVTTAVHILADLITMICRKAIKQEAANCSNRKLLSAGRRKLRLTLITYSSLSIQSHAVDNVKCDISSHYKSC